MLKYSLLWSGRMLCSKSCEVFGTTIESCVQQTGRFLLPYLLIALSSCPYCQHPSLGQACTLKSLCKPTFVTSRALTWQPFWQQGAANRSPRVDLFVFHIDTYFWCAKCQINMQVYVGPVTEGHRVANCTFLAISMTSKLLCNYCQ